VNLKNFCINRINSTTLLENFKTIFRL